MTKNDRKDSFMVSVDTNTGSKNKCELCVDS